MLATAIFLITLLLVIVRPRGLGIGTSALAGALAALLSGVVQWADVAIVWGIVWDASFTLVALIIISLILDEAGVFTWAALHVARHAAGRTRRLFVWIILLGALIAALFANDGAVMLLTPIVMAILLRLKLPPHAVFAFLIATGFVADTTSLPLVTSNLVNIVTANYFKISFSGYAVIMAPVNLVSLAATLIILWFVLGRRIPTRYDPDTLDHPASAIKDSAIFRASFPLMAVLLAAYFIASPRAIPVSLVTALAALVLIVIAGRWWQKERKPVVLLSSVMRQTPWQIVIFSFGMYLVVYGMGKAGLTQYGGRTLDWLAQQGGFVATVGTGFLFALVASVMNNLPSTLMAALSIDATTTSSITRDLMIHASVIGNDLGPKLTPIGSLATLLWLHVLATKGHKIGWGQYMKIGLLITPPVLLAALAMLYAWYTLIRM